MDVWIAFIIYFGLWGLILSDYLFDIFPKGEL